MTVIDTSLRSAVAEALQLLERPNDTRIAQARAVLQQALAHSRVIPEPYLDDLASDDGLQAALANAADPDAPYFRVDPETGDTDDTPVLLNRGDDLTDAEGRRLAIE